MYDDKYVKSLKNAKFVAIFLLVLVVIALIINLASGVTYMPLILGRLFQIALLIGTAVGMSNEATYGPICGIIVSILLILAFDILDVALGICYLIDNVKILKQMNN